VLKPELLDLYGDYQKGKANLQSTNYIPPRQISPVFQFLWHNKGC